MRAVSPRFIACPSDLERARIVVYGIPFEGRVNLRKGADTGPRDLRLASDSIETYSPALGRDLEHLPLADITVVEINPDETPLTSEATFSLRGPSGVVLPELSRAAGLG